MVIVGLVLTPFLDSLSFHRCSGEGGPLHKESVEMKSPAVLNDTNTTLLDLRNLVQQFVAQRDWQHFHNLKNLSMSLSIEAAELMEHTQWLTTSQVESLDLLDLHAISEELADVLAYTLAIANALQIDLSTALREKMVKNRAKYPLNSPRTARGLPTQQDPDNQRTEPSEPS